MLDTERMQISPGSPTAAALPSSRTTRTSVVARMRPAVPGWARYSSPTDIATAPVVSVMPKPVPGTARGNARVISASIPDCNAWPPVDTLVSDFKSCCVIAGERSRSHIMVGTQGNCVTFSVSINCKAAAASQRRISTILPPRTKVESNPVCKPLV